MQQKVLTVVVEVRPESSIRLHQLMSDFDAQQEPTAKGEQKFDKLRSEVPLLHFLSMTVFPDDQYNPIFVLEANFDGPTGPFWSQVEAAMGETLREIFRCCKPPKHDNIDKLFIEITKKGSRQPITPLLDACTVLPAVYHQGNRGLDRRRILDEGKLFDAIQTHLKNQVLFQGMTAHQVHQELRKLLLPDFPWLNFKTPPRVSRAEKIFDFLRLLGFILLLIGALSLPTLLVSLITTFLTQLINPAWVLLVLLVIASLFILRTPQACSILGELLSAPRFFKNVAVTGWVIMVIGALICLTALVVTSLEVEPEWLPNLVHVALISVGILTTLRGLVYWLRWLECRDSSNDAPVLNEEAMLAMAQREDKIAQNHMCSIVHLKPGILRAVLVRVGLRGLGLWLRFRRGDGYLNSMRTIHFAHWALINNGSRLMFLSNFDGSWESYLDDFIEKAHTGLTLAWSGGIGFPSTRFLVGEGAAEGRKFKIWARHSMVESTVWFSAYKEYTVNQIERHARISQGLCRATLSDMEAKGWALDL